MPGRAILWLRLNRYEYQGKQIQCANALTVPREFDMRPLLRPLWRGCRRDAQPYRGAAQKARGYKAVWSYTRPLLQPAVFPSIFIAGEYNPGELRLSSTEKTFFAEDRCDFQRRGKCF